MNEEEKASEQVDEEKHEEQAEEGGLEQLEQGESMKRRYNFSTFSGSFIEI